MNFAVVPIKYLDKAKRRLSDVLSSTERRCLVLAMLEDVLMALTGSESLDRVLAITPDRMALAMAQRLGVEVIEENGQMGENSALEIATEICLQRGAGSMLAIPADVPLLMAEDVDYIVNASSDPPSVVVIPSRDGRGVNALFRRPPDAIPLRFGREGLRNHLEEAGAKEALCRVCWLPRVALDIDLPEDLVHFVSRKSPTRAYEELAGMGIVERVKGWSLEEKDHGS